MTEAGRGGRLETRPRRGRRVVWVLVTVLVVLMVAFAGATRYVSNLLIEAMSTQDYSEDLPDSVVAVDEQSISLEMGLDPGTDARGDGIAGVRFGPSDDDYVQAGAVSEVDGTTVTRPVTAGG